MLHWRGGCTNDVDVGCIIRIDTFQIFALHDGRFMVDA
jgi:hypothetical protein